MHGNRKKKKLKTRQTHTQQKHKQQQQQQQTKLSWKLGSETASTKQDRTRFCCRTLPGHQVTIPEAVNLNMSLSPPG